MSAVNWSRGDGVVPRLTRMKQSETDSTTTYSTAWMMRDRE